MIVQQRVAALDATLFDHIDSQTSNDDRRSLLTIHDAVASHLGQFTYLEIGSHLGGTLQAFVSDPRCVRITSIDPRPSSQPDDRGQAYTYEDNSTARMLKFLEGVPDGDLSKLRTIEDGTQNIPAGELARADLAFIDGEHTYNAALRDARFCRTVMHGAGVILFHDRSVIEPAIRDFLRETRGPARAYPLRTSMFVVELGAGNLLKDPSIKAQVTPPAVQAWLIANRLRGGRLMLAGANAARRVRDRRR